MTLQRLQMSYNGLVPSELSTGGYYRADNAKRGATIYEQQIIIESLEEEIARLLNWIRGGDHRRSCPQSKMLLLESDPEPEPCTCGLDEILNPKGGE